MQIRGILLIAWAQWPQSVSTADALTTCAERRTRLASALDVITRLEAELEEARRWKSEKALEVMRCELNTTTLQSSGEPPQESARHSAANPTEHCDVIGAPVSSDLLWGRQRILMIWRIADHAAHVTQRRAEKSLRRIDGDNTVSGCNYCLTFQRVSDYALPRSVRPSVAHLFVLPRSGAQH